MSRSHHGKKPPGYEYWGSRLHRYGEAPGRYTKTQTARLERRRDKEIEKEAMKVPSPEEILEQTRKEELIQRLDSELGLRLKAIYGEYVYKFLTPAMFDSIRAAVGWIEEGSVRKCVDDFHHVSDREIQSVVNLCLTFEGGL